MSEADNKILARRLLEEVGNTGLVDRLPEFMANDCRVPNSDIQGLALFREHLLMFHRCCPDMLITVEGQVAEGDKVRNDRIVEHFGGSDSLEALLELGVVKWVNSEPVKPAE